MCLCGWLAPLWSPPIRITSVEVNNLEHCLAHSYKTRISFSQHAFRQPGASRFEPVRREAKVRLAT
jgi:hypothetical protein